MLSNTYYPLTWGSLDGVEPQSSFDDEYSDTFLGQLTVMNPSHWTGGTPITYDEIGNPVSYWGIDLTWGNGRELTSAIGSGIYAEYTYDSNGLRTSKKLDDYFVHTYKYINGKVCYEEYEDKKLWFFYDADGNPSHFRYFHDETEYEDYYYGCNWRGDVIAIFDSEGNLVGSYDYDAWGNAISLNDADGNYINNSLHITHINPIRYRGYYCDTETGFYYLNSRYYDPANHRFLNADESSVVSDYAFSLTDKNLYLYCDNNPVMRIDTDGELWDTVLDIAFIVGDVASILANPTNVIGYAELAADVVGLAVPGLTGGGKIVRIVANSDDVLKAGKLIDNVIDSKKAIKSSKKLGKEVHKSYDPIKKAVSHNDKLLNRSLKKYGSKLRPDAVDLKNRIIYELKPYNKNSYRRALKQTKKYAKILGDKWKIVIDFYR